MPTPVPTTGVEAFLADHEGTLQALVLRYCRGSLGLDRADVAQQARLRMWRVLEREKELQHAASYLKRVVISVVIDGVRRLKAKRETPLEQAAAETANTTPDRVAANAELGRTIRQALDTLAPDRRRAVALFLQGFTASEAARLCRWTEGRARNLMYRGLGDLRLELRQRGVER